MTNNPVVIYLAGCGAIGSHIAMMLAAPNQQWVLYDDDRVERDNVLTSAFSSEHVGAMKVHALAEMMLRKVGNNIRVETVERTLTGHTFPYPYELILDCFDNAQARLLTRSMVTLHIGVSPERLGVVHWEGVYQYGSGQRGQPNVICTHELGQQIIQLTAATAAGVVRHYLQTGTRRNITLTERMRWLE